VAAGLLGGIESGGTKVVCAVGTRPDQILERCQFPTTQDPGDAFRRAADFFSSQAEKYGHGLRAIGVGSFGPCSPNRASANYGHVTSTPKPGWADTDVVGGLRKALSATGASPDIPISFETDVNAAALAEAKYGAAVDVASMIYVTVGTGIGGGAIVNGNVVHGLMHPEMGHILLARPASRSRRTGSGLPLPDPGISAFEGICPYHGDCWEGLASGPAIEARWGAAAEDLPVGHQAWTLEAEYLATGLHALVCVLSPERVVLGGGVGSAPHLLPLVRSMLQESLAGYIHDPAITRHMDSYLVSPKLGPDSGVVGALMMADLVRETRGQET
jgi:fructokinase